MSFLRKILNKTNRDNQKRGFNLKKAEIGSFTITPPPINQNVPVVPTQTQTQTQTPVAPPVEQQPTAPPVYISQNAMKMRTYIEENMNAPQIQPIPKEFLANDNELIFFRNAIGYLIPDEAKAEAFFDKAQQITHSRTETIEPEVPVGDLFSTLWGLEDGQVFMKMLAGVKNGLRNNPKIGNDETKAHDVAFTAARVAFGPPKVHKDTGREALDQRINFFLNKNNIDKMPPSALTYYDHFLAMVDFEAQQSMGGKSDLTSLEQYNEITEELNVKDLKTNQRWKAVQYLKGKVGDELLSTLKNIIENVDPVKGVDPSIQNWVYINTGYGTAELEDELVSLDAKIGDEDSGGMGTTLKEDTQGEAGRFRVDTDDERIKDIDISKNMVKIFAEKYLQKIMSKVTQTSNELYDRMMQDATNPVISERKRQKLNSEAQKLFFYIKESEKQIRETFKTDNFKVKSVYDEMKFVREGQAGTRPGFMSVPEQEIKTLIFNLGKNLRTPLDQLAPDSPELISAIEDYINDYTPDWSPDWSGWVSESSVVSVYKQIGNYKKKIKEYQQAGYNAETIDDQLHVTNDLFNGDKRRAYTFINSVQMEENSQIKEWMNAESSKGIQDPKAQFATVSKTYMDYLHYLRDDPDSKSKFAPTILRSFFSLVKPHNDVISGGKNAASPSAAKNMNYTQLYYDLILKKLDVEEVGMRENEAKLIAKEKALKKKILTLDRSKVPGEQKQNMIFDVQNKLKGYQETLRLFDDYRKKQKKLKTLTRVIYQTEWDKNKLDKEFLKKKGHYPISPDGDIIYPKGILTLIKKLRKAEYEKEQIEQDIAEYKASTTNMRHISSSQIKIIQSYLEQCIKNVNKLGKIQKRFSNIKTASDMSAINSSIYAIVSDFEHQYGHLFN